MRRQNVHEIIHDRCFMVMFTCRCTGNFYDKKTDIDTGGVCTAEKGVYGPTCRQTPTATDGKASFLSYEYLSEVSSYN